MARHAVAVEDGLQILLVRHRLCSRGWRRRRRRCWRWCRARTRCRTWDGRRTRDRCRTRSHARSRTARRCQVELTSIGGRLGLNAGRAASAEGEHCQEQRGSTWSEHECLQWRACTVTAPSKNRTAFPATGRRGICGGNQAMPIRSRGARSFCPRYADAPVLRRGQCSREIQGLRKFSGRHAEPLQDGAEFVFGHVIYGYCRADGNGDDEVQPAVNHFLVAPDRLEDLRDGKVGNRG